jgi:hypothetical protein
MNDEGGCKPQIDYPCSWVYKVIGRNREQLQRGIAEAMAGTAYRVTSSRSSRGGGYHSFNVEITVDTERIRLELYERLRSLTDVIMVM